MGQGKGQQKSVYVCCVVLAVANPFLPPLNSTLFEPITCASNIQQFPVQTFLVLFVWFRNHSTSKNLPTLFATPRPKIDLNTHTHKSVRLIVNPLNRMVSRATIVKLKQLIIRNNGHYTRRKAKAATTLKLRCAAKQLIRALKKNLPKLMPYT